MNPAPPALLAPLEDKYEILDKVREGGMGAIYRVRHRLLGEVRVVKVMRPHLVGNGPLRERFLREARTAIRLRHPNIAHLYDFSADPDGPAFIVMEHIEGMTLEELLKRFAPPPIALTLEIARQGLRALSFLHEKGFVHRDISPDNLMLTEDADGVPQVKLIDLGIAKALAEEEGGELTHTGAFLGKVRYAAPEQLEGSDPPRLDERSDLYSFGIVLYELLTGRYPIEGRDPSAILAGHLFRQPLSFAVSDPMGKVPGEVRRAVLRAMSKDPKARFASAREFARELSGDVPPEAWSRPDLVRVREPRAEETSAAETFGTTGASTVPEPVRGLPSRKATRPLARVAGAVLALALAGLALGSDIWAARLSRPFSLLSGVLVLRAAPWGEVVEIRDEEGSVVAQGLYTSLALPLPPGRYQVRLRYPDGTPAMLPAEVKSGVTVRYRYFSPLASYDERDFFRSLGW